MDPEFAEAIGQLRISSDETRHRLDDLYQNVEDLRQHVDTIASDLRQHFDVTAADLRRDFAMFREEMLEANRETRSHMGVLVEGLRSEFRLVAEQLVASSASSSRRDADLGERHERLDRRVMQLEG